MAERREPEKHHKDGLVHTAWPLAAGKMLQVTVVETVEKWAGSMVSVRGEGGEGGWGWEGRGGEGQ